MKLVDLSKKLAEVYDDRLSPEELVQLLQEEEVPEELEDEEYDELPLYNNGMVDEMIVDQRTHFLTFCQEVKNEYGTDLEKIFRREGWL